MATTPGPDLGTSPLAPLPLCPVPTTTATNRPTARHLSPNRTRQQGGTKEGPYLDLPPLCPFRLLPLLIYSGSTIAFLKILKVQGPKSKNIENVILLQP